MTIESLAQLIQSSPTDTPISNFHSGYGTPEAKQQYTDMSQNDKQLTTFVITRLRNRGCQTIEQVRQVSDEELTQIPFYKEDKLRLTRRLFGR